MPLRLRKRKPDIEAIAESLRRGLRIEARAVIAVVGPKGGVGKSTLAAALAWLLSSTPTVLVDADPSAVSSSLLRARCGGPGLHEFLAGHEEVAICGREDGALVDAIPPGEAGSADPARLPPLLEQLVREYRLVVLDTPPLRWLEPTLRAVLEASDAVLVVTDATAQAQQAARATALAIRNAVQPPPITYVIQSRSRGKADADMAVPYDANVEKAMSSDADIATVMARARRFARAVRSLAATLARDLSGRTHTRRVVQA